MNAKANSNRIRELRRFGLKSLLTGIVILFGFGCICFIVLDEKTGAITHYSSSGRGLGLFVLSGVWGLWNIVRGIIYLIRAQSGNEHYAKGIEDVIDKYGSRHAERLGRNVGNGSMRNVLVLLLWFFLVLAFVGASLVGYLYWTRQ